MKSMKWKRQFRVPNLAFLDASLLASAIGFPPQSWPLPPLQPGNMLRAASAKHAKISSLVPKWMWFPFARGVNTIFSWGWMEGLEAAWGRKIPRSGWILFFYESVQQNGQHCPWHSATCAARHIWLPRGLCVNVSLRLKILTWCSQISTPPLKVVT